MLPESSIEHASWFVRDLTDRLLPLWLEKAPRENGFFFSQFDREWNPKEVDEGTLVSQSRLIYTMAAGYARTGDQRYRTAAEKGIEFLEAHFRDSEAPGYIWSCRSDGALVDEAKHSYGHSFVIYAYANAASMLGNGEYGDRAKRVWDEYREGFGHADGGYYHVMTRNFVPSGEPLSQNPMMHLFEALVCLGSLAGHEAVLRDAGGLADFIINRLIDVKTGFLPELFNASWLPIKESDGNRVDVGHAFEWGFLLSDAVRRGLPKRFLSYAHQFLDAGLTLGFDRERGLVFSPASLDGEKVKRTNSYWEQCEALRTLFHFAALRDRPELSANFDILAGFVRAHYIDEEHGGWYTTITPKGTPSDTKKGGIYKLDYHQTSMTLELARILESQSS